MAWRRPCRAASRWRRALSWTERLRGSVFPVVKARQELIYEFAGRFIRVNHTRTIHFLATQRWISFFMGMKRYINKREHGDLSSLNPSTIFVNNRLSWRAKGLLVFLLGLPEASRDPFRTVLALSSEGATAVRHGIEELRAEGFLKTETTRRCGRIVAWEWHISDMPMFDTSAKPLDVPDRVRRPRPSPPSDRID